MAEPDRFAGLGYIYEAYDPKTGEMFGFVFDEIGGDQSLVAESLALWREKGLRIERRTTSECLMGVRGCEVE